MKILTQMISFESRQMAYLTSGMKVAFNVSV